MSWTGFIAIGLGSIVLAWSPPTPADQPVFDPVSEAYKLNSALGRYYSEIEADKTKRDPDLLRGHLKGLMALDDHFGLMGPKRDDDRRLEEAKRFRAIAWLHGWASFSILVADADPARRDTLLTLHPGEKEDSVLGLLLSIYEQIHGGKVKDPAPSPLQNQLARAPDLVYLLKYQQWKNAAPDGFTHHYYIPSTEDMIGKPSDEGANEYKLFSLWSVVNLQLDRWRDLPPGDPNAALSLNGLIAWLKALELEERLASFDVGGKIGRGAHLRQCAKNMHFFLAFRQDCAIAGNFEERVRQLSLQRILPNPEYGQCFRLRAEAARPANDASIRTLIDAAKPIIDPDGQPGYLTDAAIWLRYLLLLSYKDDASVAATIAKNGMHEVWNGFGTGHPLWFESAGPAALASPAGAHLRWNCKPAHGNVSGVVADLTSATFMALRFDAWLRFEGSEKSLLLSLRNEAPDDDYAKNLGAEIAMLEGCAGQLQAYLTTRAGDVAGDRKAPASGPLDPIQVDGPVERNLAASATTAERDCLLGDLKFIANGLNSTIRVQRLIHDAYQLKDPILIATALKTLGGQAALSEIRPYELPRETFEQYAKSLNAASLRLKEKATDERLREELRHRYDQAKLGCEKSEALLAASELGVEIADRAIALSDTYLSMAGLDVEIEKLGSRIAELEREGDKLTREGRDVLLDLKRRQRDLAVVEVEALIVASEQASEMIAGAQKSLGELQAQLIKEAEANKDGGGLFGAIVKIIKAVVDVVGVALSPFTGGASLAVAKFMDKALDIVETIDRQGFNVGTILEGVHLAEKHWGALEGSKALRDVQNWVKGVETDVNKMIKPVGEFFEQIKEFDRGEIGGHLTALANGLPVKYVKATGKLTVELGSRVSFEKSLQDSLRPFLEKGGIIAVDAKTRVEELARLLKLDDPKLRDELPKALENLLKVCPKELRDKFEEPFGDFEKTKADLISKLRGLDSGDLRRFLGCLSEGKIVIKIGAEVVAFEKRADAEIIKNKERLKKFTENVIKGELSALANRIEAKYKSIEERRDKFLKVEDYDGLEKYAKGGLPTQIEELKTELDVLKEKIDAANRGLEDKEDELTIATYDADAARFFAEAGQVKLDQAIEKNRRVALELTARQQGRDISVIGRERENKRLLASGLNCKMSRAELRRAYSACLDFGFNPESGDAIDPAGKDGLRAILTGPVEPDHGLKLFYRDRMAANLFGMIRWVNLLDLKSEISGQTSRTPLERSVQFLNSSRDEKLIAEMAGEMEAVFEKARKGANIVPASFVHIGHVVRTDRNPIEEAGWVPISWFDRMALGDRDRWLQELEETQRSQALGVFQVRIGRVETRSEQKGAAPLRTYPMENKAASSYLLLDETKVHCHDEDSRRLINPANLRFVLIPPVRAFSDEEHSFDPGDGGSTASRRIEFSSGPAADQRRRELEKGYKLERTSQLTGAMGIWTVFVLHVGQPEERQREKPILRDSLIVDLEMWCLEVDHPRKSER